MHTSKLVPRLALLALSLAMASCGGRSQKQTSPSAVNSGGRCYESPRSYSESSDDSDAPSAAPDAEGGSYGGDYEACDPVSAPMQDTSAESEISRLSAEIRDLRLQGGLEAEPLVSEATEVESMSVEEIQSSADHAEPKSQVCIATCTIETSICKNAQSICRLADNIPDNQWAAEKCSSGKASCKEATQQCADCVAGESAALPE